MRARAHTHTHTHTHTNTRILKQHAHTHRKRDNFDFRRADDDFFSHKQKHIQRLDYEEKVVWQSVHTQQFTDTLQLEIFFCAPPQKKITIFWQKTKIDAQDTQNQHYSGRVHTCILTCVRSDFFTYKMCNHHD